MNGDPEVGCALIMIGFVTTIFLSVVALILLDWRASVMVWLLSLFIFGWLVTMPDELDGIDR